MARAARTYDLLMIDDDAVDRQQYSRLLKRHSVGLSDIREAHDGTTGLKALRARTPDCVLLDYQLPDMTGLEFLAAATEDGVLPCAVVLITGRGDAAIAVAAWQFAVYEYLDKVQLDGGRLWHVIMQAVAHAERTRSPADLLAQLTGKYTALGPANAAQEQAITALEAHAADGTESAACKSACRRILLVDDIAMNRDVIGGMLRAAGHKVVLAGSGAAAMRLAFEQCFDLIIMDVRMPEVNGLMATRHIRTYTWPRGAVPILALTAYNLIDQVGQCFDAGMNAFVAKPVNYATLIRAINDVFPRPTVLNCGLSQAW